MRPRLSVAALCLAACAAPVPASGPVGRITVDLAGDRLMVVTDPDCGGLCHADLGWHGDARGAFFMTVGNDAAGNRVTLSVGWNGPFVPGGLPAYGLVAVMQGEAAWSGTAPLTRFDLTFGDPVAALADQAHPGAVIVTGSLRFAGTVCRELTGPGPLRTDPDDCVPVSGRYDGPVQIAAQNRAATGI